MDTRVPLLLVVDDDPAIRSLLAEFFEDEGYRVTTRDAVEPADVMRLAPDLAILDRGVGPAGQGLRLLRALRADLATTHLPILLVTGAARQVEEEAEELAALGVVVVLKPFDLEDLLGRVRALLGESRGTGRAT